MYLKALEIQGFKSFPDHTVLRFGRGVTAIVGPNGSGKSNIVDAIRWVLGEQSSKTLRGGKMEDVIFGGTQKRTPMGFCEVTLVLDNTDGAIDLEYGELSVTRRYYRSGESEFFINRKTVRLRDIHELFMDTGLGRDGYSVIGQGRIDEILSVKSTERREIFEEAAGITKFRHRKAESERKLNGCEENLVRIRDIITELEGQVAPLQAQAEKAKKYLHLRDELRVLEVSVWLDGLEKLKDNLQNAQREYDNAERMLSAKQRALDELQQTSEQYTAQMQETDRQSEQARAQLREIEQQHSALQSQIAANTASIASNEEHIARQRDEVAQQQQRGDSLKEQLARHVARHAELECALQEQEKAQQALQQTVLSLSREAEDRNTRHAALRLSYEMAQQQSADLSARHSALQSTLHELSQQAQTLAQEAQQLQARAETEVQRAEELKEQREENEQKWQSADNMRKGFALRINTRRTKVEQLEAALGQDRRKSESAQDRLSLLTAMEREYEGFSHAVREVMRMRERGQLQHIHGPVSTLIETDARFSVALEIALGGNLQNIVVDTEQDAKAAILMLKNGNLGRATFLPLSAVKPRGGERRKLDGAPGFLGYADTLLRADAQYRTLLGSLLGGIAVVESIDDAIALAKQHRYAFSIVTLDGQRVNASGAMSGGSLNKKVGMLSRANEKKALQQQIETMNQALAAQQTALRAARQELDVATHQAEAAGGELRAAEDALLSLRTEQQQHGALRDAIDAQLAQNKTQQDTLQSRVAAQTQDLQQTAQKQRANEEQLAQLRAQIEAVRGDSAQTEQEQGALHEQLTALRMDMAAANSEREASVQSIAQLEQLVAQMDGERGDKEQIIAHIAQKNAVLQAELGEWTQTCAAWQQDMAQHTQQIKTLTEQRLQLEASRVRGEQQIKQHHNELINLERERGRLENKKTQAEMEEDSIIQKLWEQYELTRVTAQEVRRPVENLPKTNRRIAELRSGIKALGDVHVGAIEEFEKVNERFTFLATQRDDLERAQKDLLTIIAELTKNMQSMFAEQFARINETFRETFTEIFGGGSGYLKLEDENDLLNCGIEIKVELPGKSMRAISLLSGGEKAFVAIALYFAIIKVRPTPFCVLDEIEAALDDVNVLRFSDYLRTLCHKTQFVVITHRRGTMEGADILYGVTMQEQGVTKLLALNIGEVEQQIKLKPN